MNSGGYVFEINFCLISYHVNNELEVNDLWVHGLSGH